MMRKLTVKITIIIVVFSALPMVPNAAIEMYIIRNIRTMKEMIKTIMMMKGGWWRHHDDDQGDDDSTMRMMILRSSCFVCVDFLFMARLHPGEVWRAITYIFQSTGSAFAPQRFGLPSGVLS